MLPWSNQSPIDAVLARAATTGTASLVRGVTLPASISDATVSTFSTEPGS